MPDAKGPSFGRLVFVKAISETRMFFGSTPRDSVLAVVSLAIGFGLYWYFKGLPDAMGEATSVVAFTFAPIGFGVVVVFLWNLWLAPFALAYETTKSALRDPKLQSDKLKKDAAINWAPWKQRAQYTLYEFAKILSKTDPGSPSMDTEGSSFLQLLLEEAQNDKLKSLPTYRPDVWGDMRAADPDYQTKVEKGDAVVWAQGKSFPVDHIL